MKQLKYADGKHAIHCPTMELAQKVAEIADKAGFTYFSGNSFLDAINTDVGKIYLTNGGLGLRIFGTSGGIGPIEFYSSKPELLAIIPAEEFIRANTGRNLEGVQVGDRGWTVQCGDGVFVSIDDDTQIGPYCLNFKGDDGRRECYTMSGLDYESDAFPSAYYARPIYDFPLRPIPAWVPEKGEAVWVRSSVNTGWSSRIFKEHKPGADLQYGVSYLQYGVSYLQYGDLYDSETLYYRFCEPSNGGTLPKYDE